MTHDERRLLCLVARLVQRDLREDSKPFTEVQKLIQRVQRHACIESANTAARLVKDHLTQ